MKIFKKIYVSIKSQNLDIKNIIHKAGIKKNFILSECYKDKCKCKLYDKEDILQIHFWHLPLTDIIDVIKRIKWFLHRKSTKHVIANTNIEESSIHIFVPTVLIKNKNIIYVLQHELLHLLSLRHCTKNCIYNSESSGNHFCKFHKKKLKCLLINLNKNDRTN